MTVRTESHFFGRRKGKALRAHQASLMDRLLPQLRVKPADLSAATPSMFGEFSDLWLEIGFGGGEHLASDALAHPDVCYIGCEPFVNGVAKLLASIEANRTSNIRIHDGDALEVLEVLPPASLGRVTILYPDPWPKVRQKKRRFISPRSVGLIAQALRPGCELRFATDIDDYSAWTLAHLAACSAFEWRAAEAADWRTPWTGWPGTRYEAKALREGRTPAYLTFIRKD